MSSPDVTQLLASALLVDTATAGFLYTTGYGGSAVREWYRTLRGGAYGMDVLSLVIGAYVALRIAPDHLWTQLALVVAVQMTHDVAFGAFVQSGASKGPLMSLFGRYAGEMGGHILWADAVMMVSTVLAYRVLSGLSVNDAAFVGALSAYVGLLVVYSF